MLAAWQDDISLFADQHGLHKSPYIAVPVGRTHHLLCANSSLHLLPGVFLWQWKVAQVPLTMLVAWCLAYRPNYLVRPGVAWQSSQPLTYGQRLSLLTGFLS